MQSEVPNECTSGALGCLDHFLDLGCICFAEGTLGIGDCSLIPEHGIGMTPAWLCSSTRPRLYAAQYMHELQRASESASLAAE